jgi:hypothetical protein
MSEPPELPEPAHLVGRVAAFADDVAAVEAARALVDAGIPADRVGLVGRDDGALRAALEAVGSPVRPVHERPEDLAAHLEPAGRDALVGAVLGGAVGLGVGLGPLLIPVFGASLLAYAGLTIAGEALLATVVGSGLGAFFGRVFERDVEERHLARWREALDAGGWLVVVRDEAAAMETVDRVLAARPTRHLDVLAS